MPFKKTHAVRRPRAVAVPDQRRTAAKLAGLQSEMIAPRRLQAETAKLEACSRQSRQSLRRKTENKARNWSDVRRSCRNTKGWLVLFALLLSACAIAKPEEETSAASDLRPFYVIGHGANSIHEVMRCLSSGANALELDVNVYRSDHSKLCIGHGPNLWTGGCGDKAPALADYLKVLHEIARTNTNLTLVYFDCKPLVATATNGVQLLDAIRTLLMGYGANAVDLNVIVSVAHLKPDGAMFERIGTSVGPTEALLVDGDRDTGKVSSFFAGLNVANQCLGYGSSVLNRCCEYRIHPSIKTACALRATNTNVRLVITYTVNNPRVMRKYIRTGVDGILVDRSSPFYNCGDGLKGMRKLLEAEGAKLGIRKAGREDHPFVRLQDGQRFPK